MRVEIEDSDFLSGLFSQRLSESQSCPSKIIQPLKKGDTCLHSHAPHLTISLSPIIPNYFPIHFSLSRSDLTPTMISDFFLFYRPKTRYNMDTSILLTNPLD